MVPRETRGTTRKAEEDLGVDDVTGEAIPADLIKKARKVRKKGDDLTFAKLAALGEEVVVAGPHPMPGKALLSFGRTWARRFASRHDMNLFLALPPN